MPYRRPGSTARSRAVPSGRRSRIGAPARREAARQTSSRPPPQPPCAGAASPAARPAAAACPGGCRDSPPARTAAPAPPGAPLPPPAAADISPTAPPTVARSERADLPPRAGRPLPPNPPFPIRGRGASDSASHRLPSSLLRGVRRGILQAPLGLGGIEVSPGQEGKVSSHHPPQKVVAQRQHQHEAVQPVEQPAEARQPRPRVLHARLALEQRLQQVAPYRPHRHHHC
jgi:hypothetical protein